MSDLVEDFLSRERSDLGEMGLDIEINSRFDGKFELIVGFCNLLTFDEFIKYF
jgi:hypothetical protein